MSLKFVLICYHLRIYWVGSIQYVESSLSAKFQPDLLSNSGIIANKWQSIVHVFIFFELVTSFDLVYFIFDEDLIDIFCQHLFHDYPISCITTIMMLIPVPTDRNSKGTGVSSRIFN